MFAAGGVEYTWGDVVVAARLRGDWTTVARDARRGAMALAELDSRGEEIDPLELEAAGAAFRYERDLLSGDEMEAWLERWDLSALEWSEWLGRVIARERVAGQADQRAAQHEPDHDEVETATAVEAVCSGALERWARELAERAAVSLSRGVRVDATSPPDPPPARGVLALDPAQWVVATAKVAPLDLPLEGTLGDAIDGTAIGRELALHRVDWLAFECGTLRFAEERMAREAVLCLRDDERTLDQVAAAAGVAVQRGELVLEDAPEQMQPALLGAREGELVGPVEDEGEYVVTVVDGKREPGLGDVAVAARARRRALERVLRREVDARVRWHERV